MILLLVAGVVVGAAGFLAVGFGIPIKDTTFGNTIQLAGITLLCTALLLVGLALVVRELKAVTRALGQGATRVAQRGQPGRGPQAIRPAMPPNPLAPVVEQPGAPLAAEPVGAEPQQPGAAAVPPPWAAEAAARERSRMAPAEDGPATVQPPENAAPPAPPAVPERPRRNLLFATRRRERAEQSTGGSADQLMPTELPPMAPPVLPPKPALEAEPRASFDSAWPASRGNDSFGRRGRAPEQPPAAEAGTTPEASTAESAGPASSETPSGVTVIKSGVVDGMAYSLYSDGSIEAQMPEGMLRFASLDELRSHLEQRP